MAIARQTDASKIKPSHHAVVIEGTAGAAIVAGELVTLQSDGFWDPAIGTGVVTNIGVSVKAAAAGDAVEVVVLGPVACLTGATKGAIVYVSDTAGEPAEAAGTKSAVAGYVLSLPNEQDTQWLMVIPQTVAFA